MNRARLLAIGKLLLLLGIPTGLVLTLGLETAAYAKVFTLPAGVTVTGLTLVASLLVFLGVSFATRNRASDQLDADVRAVMRL